MNPEPQSRPEILPLTGIRAAAALWVVLFHLQGHFIAAFPWCAGLYRALFGRGYLGVDLFFILSGFIIFYNYAERLRTGRPLAIAEFLWMRLARLWPVHAALLVAFVALLWVQRRMGVAPGQPELYTWPDFWRNLALIHGWSFPLNVSWNTPAWSISCEWLAYLLFPFLILSRLCTRSTRLSAMVAMAALFGTAGLLQLWHGDESASFGVVRILGEFLAGCALCHVFRAGGGRQVAWEFIVPLAAAAAIVGSAFMLPHFGLVDYWSVPWLGLIVLGLAHHRGAVARFFSSRAMRFGGSISYSLYMVHNLAFIVLKRTDPRLGPAAPFVDLLVTILAATALYYVIEEPCRKALRRVFPRHRQQPYPVI